MGSHTNSTIMESVDKSLNTKIDQSVKDHVATVYVTVFLLIQTATAGFYVGIENNTLMSAPIFYKAGYPWLGPGGIIDGCATLWNVCLWGKYAFTECWGGRKPAGLVRLAFVLVIGYGTGGILALYPITDINDCRQWAPTLFIVQRTIHCFFLAAVSSPRDRKHFYIIGTLLSFLQNLFIIENGTPALGLDLLCIAILIGFPVFLFDFFRLIEGYGMEWYGPGSSLNLVGKGWTVFYASLLSILRETLLFGNFGNLYNGSTYITLAVICGYVIIYTENNLFPAASKGDTDFVKQACKFFLDFVSLIVMIVKKVVIKVYIWFVKNLL